MREGDACATSTTAEIRAGGYASLTGIMMHDGIICRRQSTTTTATTTTRRPSLKTPSVSISSPLPLLSVIIFIFIRCLRRAREVFSGDS
ncbi:unnamed protein product [Heligmosomoides polygyrus]|uniref:Uncharacterized protein n=1 Tax=Heligmosomoides polygyrus TaxID=6339 RepID=A0A183FSU4_HELPZ|nr:unnamed protein product [Heligmosomoides polygyrus]